MQENNKEITIQDVISKKKETSRRVDTKLIMKAYNYAVEHHGEQKRRSGEPYIIHPLNVAYILAGVGLDEATICAALLHDVVEDTDATDADLRAVSVIILKSAISASLEISGFMAFWSISFIG